MFFSSNNMAKQWIFESLDELFPEKEFQVLDLACGDSSPWFPYLRVRENCKYQGFDYNKVSLKKGQKLLEPLKNANSEFGDAQKLANLEPVDVVTAFSALEHVVDLRAFCQTVFDALKPQGYAFLNYDIGHFRSYNAKERIMVPISQTLAKVGVEGPYMKAVDDISLLQLLQELDFELIECRKHNINSLKRDMKVMSEEVIQEWYHFETRLNELAKPEDLHDMMLSTTLKLRRS